MTRRLWLRELMLGFWAGAAACRLRAGESRSSSTDGTSAAGDSLAPRGRTTLIALGEAVVTGQALSPAERHYLADHIEDGIKEFPGRLAQYQTAAALLDELAGKPFSSLTIADRSRLLARYRLDDRVALAPDPAEPFAATAEMVRTTIVPDLIEGYWSSPAGWGRVGYETFPGRCGDLLRYTRAKA